MSSITEAVELPRLSAENFEQVNQAYRPEKAPTDVAALHGGTGITIIERPDVTENGEPTEWTVYSHEGDVWWHIRNTLPCSYTWCQGHDTNEADAWEELRHYQADGRVAIDVDGVFRGDMTATSSLADGAAVVDVFLGVEATIPVDDVPAFIASLEQYIALLRETADTARNLK